MKQKPNVWPRKYLYNVVRDKTKEEMWEIMDGYTFEEQHEKPEKLPHIDFVIPLPPLKYKGKVLKGMFYSQAVDVVVEKFPKIKKLFIPIANSMFSSYPASEYADVYFAIYNNKERMEWYRKKHPENSDKILLPLQDSDFLNEYDIAPTFYTPKTLDVFCAMTPYPVKNVPIFAKALKIYEEKYKKRLKVTIALGINAAKKNPDGSLDYSELRFDAKEQLDKIKEILGGKIEDYINYEPFIEYKDICRYYTSAKCCVLTTLLEGKNRFIHEAMSCDTPIIVFDDFNKYSRGETPIFFGNSGEYVPEFTPESLADTIHKVITNQNNYNTRYNFLKHFGRKNFINTCIDTIPYYREKLPGYEPNKAMDNLWLDLAMQSDYQLSFHDFLYGKNPAIQTFRGIDHMKSIIEFFYARFGVR